MNSVFEKAILSLLLYIQNHYVLLMILFNSFIPTLSLLFVKGQLKPVYLQSTGSTQEGTSSHNQNIIHWNEKNQYVQANK